MHHILVVDDDESLRDTIGLLLENEGFRPVLAGDGRRGLEEALRIRPALITFRVRNLTDKLYAYYGGRATSQVLLAPGRTYELGATFEF